MPWLRRADSDTYVAGSGRLVTKIYPYPVNYRTSSGAFAPIDAGLVASGSSYGQKANDLGVQLPQSAADPAKVSTGGGSLALSLSGVSGTGTVSGSTEKFASSTGTTLSYASLSTGIGWQATLPAGQTSQGLQWVVDPSSGLSAKLVPGGVAFLNAGGKIVWVFKAPFAHLAGSTKPVRTRLSLSTTAQGTVVSVVPVTGTSASTTPAAAREFTSFSPASRATTDGVAVPVALPNPSPTVFDGQVIPGGYTFIGSPTGDCYVDQGSPDTSFCQTDTNYVGPTDHTLLNFDVADSMPTHVQILQAYVSMTLTSESTSTAESIGVWQADKQWDNFATWNDYDGSSPWDTAGGDTIGDMEDSNSIGASGDVGGASYWDLPTSMQNWVDGQVPQVEGLIFEATDGASAPNTLGFATETAVGGDAPYMEVYSKTRGGDYPGSHYADQQLTDRSTLGVDTATGNLLLSNTDLQLTGVRGVNVNIGRYYNNLSGDQDAFGVGWSMATGADTYLAIPGDNDDAIDYFDGTGDGQMFWTNADGSEHSPPGVDARLTMNGSGAWDSSTFTLKFRHSGITETFDAPVDANNKIGRLTTLQDRNNNTIHYYYNGSGQLDHLVDTYGNTTSFSYSPDGYVSEITDPTGREYRYYQNGSGQLTEYKDPAGNSTYYTYDDFGNLTQVKTAQGNITNIAYNAGATNQVTSVTRLVNPTDTSGPKTTYQYATASGTCLSNDGWTQGTVSDPNGHVTTYCSDDRSRVTKSIDANGNTRSTSYSADGFVEELDSGQNTPSTFKYTTDGNDNVYEIDHGDSSGHGGSGSSAYTTTVTKFDHSDPDPNNAFLPSDSTDPQTNENDYAYDSAGNLTSATVSGSGSGGGTNVTMSYNSDGTVETSKDGDGKETDYHYTDGNLTQVVPPTGSNLNTINLSYDSANRVDEISTVSGSSGHEVDYSYDDFDRITKAVYKNASGTVVATICYHYDNDGNLTSRTDGSGTTSYTFDGLNRITAESFPDGSSTSYGYDPASNLTSLTDGSGTVKYAYDKANQLTSVTDPGGTKPAATMTYDADGNLTHTTYASGASVVSTYNGIDQLTEVNDSYKNSGGGLVHLTYTYNYSGSLRSSMATGGDTTAYTYDRLNRLTDATTTGTHSSTYHYTLDGAGNLTNLNNNGTYSTYDYLPGNEICWEASGTISSPSCSSPPSGANNYSYDGDGNQTSNGNGLTATYNALDQTTSITQGGTTTDYSYLGESQKELVSEGTNALHNDLLGLASKQDGSGNDYYTRSTSGDQIDERTPSGTYNYLYDGNGSVVGLTDSSGHLVNQYSYDPYGNQTTVSSAAPNPFAFQDGYQTTSGLVHFGARYLNPSDARWTQEDPLNDRSSLTQSNRYAFAGVDPINASDASGALSLSISGCVFGACAGVTFNSDFSPHPYVGSSSEDLPSLDVSDSSADVEGGDTESESGGCGVGYCAGASSSSSGSSAGFFGAHFGLPGGYSEIRHYW